MATADNTTVARPYAKAAFDTAVDENQLAAWHQYLARISQLCQDGQVQALLKNPFVDASEISSLFVHWSQAESNSSVAGFVQVLAENHRLAVLPQIYALFVEHKAEYEKTLEVEVQSFLPMNDTQKSAVQRALEKRLSRQISINNQVNKSLLGGAIIYAGDLVIDGSIRGKLDKLSSEIMA